jgi:peptide deformylase
MKLPLAYYGDPILRKKAAPVEEINDEIRQLVHDMIETLDTEEGMGLAAPQVHRSLAIFLVRAPLADEEHHKWQPGTLRIFINPKILAYSDQQWDMDEACMSIPKLSAGPVTRPVQIKIEASDLEGNRTVQEFSGLEARIFMHENDHINGVLYIDRIKGKERQRIEPILREIKKRYHPDK